MKRTGSLLLTALLLLSCLPAVSAAEGGSPTPPDWVAAEDYLLFPDDPVYEPESWAQVLALRAEAQQGALLPQEGRDWAQGSPGQCYEIGLLRLKYAANAGEDAQAVGEALCAAGKAFSAAESGWYDQNRGRDTLCYRLAVEKYRAYLAYHPAYVEDWGKGIVPALDALGMTLEEFLDAPFMERVDGETRALVAASVESEWAFLLEQKNRVSVYLDGGVLLMDTLPQVKEQRTMVPIRAIAEALGADVGWEAETNRVTVTRAGSTVTMTLDDPRAEVDGVPVVMDVAPYACDQRTYIPVRYLAEFFGQQVEWDQAQRRVDIREDKSAAQGSDLEAWALAMGALFVRLEGGDPTLFGGYCRAPHPNALQTELVEPRTVCRETLTNWDIPDRETLLDTLDEILAGGHNALFQESAREVKDLTDRQIAQRTAGMSPVDQYMWPQTKALALKWEDKGILAWDLCRAGALIQWGYTAGCLSYEQAMELLEPAARRLRETFSSWDQVYENCIEGYYWCIRQDMTDTELWDTELGQAYLYVRNAPATVSLFNSQLFQADGADWEK